jgi:arylsulfatase A-like enzyme
MRRPFGGALLMGLLCALVALAPAPSAAKKHKKAKQRRPNIVLVMVDDQAAEQQRFLPKTNHLIGDAGVTFDNNFVSYSLCCPSRSTLLTGQYAHNHGVRGNTPPAGGYGKLAPFLGNSLPVWLQKSGYYTGHVGKFLNGYGATSPDTEVPPGWNEWYGALDDPDAYTGGTYTMYGYTLNENGRVVHYGSTPDVVDPATYQTDVYAAKADDFIRRRAPSNKPFYLSIAPLASHGEAASCNCDGNNPRAAPRDEGTLAGESIPTKPNFNEADVSDKPQAIQTLPLMNQTQIDAAEDRYRARAESLQAADDLVEKVVNAVRDKGELKNTVFIYTDDNGFFHGEHRVRQGKVRLYEESIRVPLLMRGPGIPKNKNRKQPVANIDLAPTIADFADAKPRRKLDGESLVPLARDGRLYPGRGILLEAFFNSDPDEDPETPPTNYQAVRTDRYLYAEYGTGETELYDLYSDPYELTSRQNDPSLAGVRAKLDADLTRLANCDGTACRGRPGVKLKLTYRSDGGCVASGVRAKLTGGDAGSADLARFFVNSKKAGADTAPPFTRTIGAGRLNSARKNAIEALVTTLDGRVTTLRRSVPDAC